MKYDTMLAKNKVESEQKIRTAKATIHEMLEQGEEITVANLVNKTGLSRGFFYKNPIVRQELETSIYKQRVAYGKPCKVASRDVTEEELLKKNSRIEELETQNEELSAMNQKLLHEIEELKKKVNKKELSLLKKL